MNLPYYTSSTDPPDHISRERNSTAIVDLKDKKFLDMLPQDEESDDNRDEESDPDYVDELDGSPPKHTKKNAGRKSSHYVARQESVGASESVPLLKRRQVEALANGPSPEEIVEAALLKPIERSKKYPQCFYETGKLRAPWKGMYTEKIVEARKKRGLQKLENNRPNIERNNQNTKLPYTTPLVIIKNSQDLLHPKSAHEAGDNSTADGTGSDHETEEASLPENFLNRGEVSLKNKNEAKQSTFSSPTIQLERETPQNISTKRPFQVENQLDTQVHGEEQSGVPANPAKRQKMSFKTSSKLTPAIRSEVAETSLGHQIVQPSEVLLAGTRKSSGGTVSNGPSKNPNAYVSEPEKPLVFKAPTPSPITPKSTEPKTLVLPSQPSSVMSQLLEAPKIPTKYGDNCLNDDDLKNPLRNMTVSVEQYTFDVLRNSACTGASGRMPILSLECIQNEHFEAGGEQQQPKLVITLKKILDIHAGVSLDAAIRATGLESDNEYWITTVLMRVIADFIFKTKDRPYEDDSLWKDTFEYSKMPPIMTLSGGQLNCVSLVNLKSETVAQIIQDNRLRTLRAYELAIQAGAYLSNEREDRVVTDFKGRVAERHKKLVAQLNAIMWPMVGNNSQINDHHEAIVAEAIKLSLKIHAYKDTFKAIYPKKGKPFDPVEHTIHDRDPRKHAGKTILMTKVIGIKVEINKGQWRICHPACVVLQN